MKVTVIPARGGSKRIPRKNIGVFCGLPMIAWPIRAAQNSGCFDRIVASTDDPEIAAVARLHGADTPFVRPKELADDLTPTRPVVEHAISALERLGDRPEHVCCLYATAPFVRAEDLRAGLTRLVETECTYVFPVTTYPFPIQRALRRDAHGRIAMFDRTQFLTRSQDLEEAWHDAGQFYWGHARQWSADEPIFGEGAVTVDLPRHRVQDIDTPEDWTNAELLFRLMNFNA